MHAIQHRLLTRPKSFQCCTYFGTGEERFVPSSQPRSPIVTVPQAFDSTIVLCCDDWWSAYKSESDSSVQLNVICLTSLQLVSLGISYFEGCVWNPPLFRSVTLR